MAVKLATFIHSGTERVGALTEDGGVIRPFEMPLSMLDLIQAESFPALGDPVPLTAVRLLAPLPRPRRDIFCVGKNYRDHAVEFSLSGYEAGADASTPIDPHPVVFTKLASSVTGPFDDVDLHPGVTGQVDYEGELAVVIGRPGRSISKAEAMSYVWGYTIINDVTARDVQKRHRQWTIGKSLDTFCPMGPWVVLAASVDIEALSIRTEVNGEPRQHGVVRDMIHTIPDVIQTISRGIGLQAGDIIATGTPAGVGIGFDPPRFLRPGDCVTVQIEGIGSMANHFR